MCVSVCIHHSFSFNSMYIDMPRWSTCKIPVLKDMDLHTFWGSSALRVAAYYLLSSDSAAAAAAGTAAAGTGATGSGSSGVSQAVQHLQKDLRYLLCIQVQHTTAADAAATAAAAASSEAQGSSDVGEEDAVQYRSKVRTHTAQLCTCMTDTCSQQVDTHAEHKRSRKLVHAHIALCMLGTAQLALQQQCYIIVDKTLDLRVDIVSIGNQCLQRSASCSVACSCQCAAEPFVHFTH
jgi:hypothetical protein